MLPSLRAALVVRRLGLALLVRVSLVSIALAVVVTVPAVQS